MNADREIVNPISAQNNEAVYDYHLKFLLVGDSDVGKAEILNYLEGYYENNLLGVYSKTSLFNLENKRIKLQLWDTSGQGRFCTIIRSYSRGAHGVLIVYDITNKWSFKGIDRWLKELDNHIPGIPKILIGNRLHLEYKREVSTEAAEQYAAKHNMEFFEVSPLCNYNVNEAIIELVALALHRIGMERIWNSKNVATLQELCCRSLLTTVKFFDINAMCLPNTMKSQLKTYFMIHHKKKNELRFPKGCLRPSTNLGPPQPNSSWYTHNSHNTANNHGSSHFSQGAMNYLSKSRSLSGAGRGEGHGKKDDTGGSDSSSSSLNRSLFKNYKFSHNGVTTYAHAKLSLLARSASKCFTLDKRSTPTTTAPTPSHSACSIL